MCSATGESAMNADSREADRALVARVQGHDAEALALLYDRHAGRLMGLAQRILGDTGEAEEILQEVFLYVWKSAATLAPSLTLISRYWFSSLLGLRPFRRVP